eukprot:COSAG02_NODE_4958_length_4781_cov_2.219564_8_plen_109_part_00
MCNGMFHCGFKDCVTTYQNRGPKSEYAMNTGNMQRHYKTAHAPMTTYALHKNSDTRMIYGPRMVENDHDGRYDNHIILKTCFCSVDYDVLCAECTSVCMHPAVPKLRY